MPNKPDWSVIDPLLGTMPDSKLAEKYNVLCGKIRWRRAQLSIPGYSQHLTEEQKSEIDTLLGTMPDNEIAEKYGTTKSTIANRRMKFNIPVFDRKLHHVKLWKHDWKEIDPLLGTLPDSELARQLNMNISTISTRRSKLNIPVYAKVANISNRYKDKWEEIDPLLGKMPDAELARRFNVGSGAVLKRRNKLNISAFELTMAHGKKRDWTKIDPLIGTMPDTDIARRFDIPKESVTGRRVKMNIRPCESTIHLSNVHHKHDWEEIDPLIGTVPDTFIRKFFRLSNTTLSKRRKLLNIPSNDTIDWEEIDPLLGKMPDNELAEKYGINFYAVVNRRQELDIPLSFEYVNFDWRKIDPILGKIPDADIARTFGMSANSVRARRRIFGIEAYQGSYVGREKINWKPIEPLLGTMSDRKLAQLFKISAASIFRKRREHGIATYSRQKRNIFNRTRENMRFMKRYDWEKIDGILGKIPDIEIAAQYKMNPRSIRNRRYKLGIST